MEPSRENIPPNYIQYPPVDPATNMGPAYPLIAPPKRRRRWPWIAGTAAVLALAGVFTAAVLLRTPDAAAPTSSAPEFASAGSSCPIDSAMAAGVNGVRLRCESGRWATVEDTAMEKPPAVAPLLSDITLTVRIKEKKCFGSAGCNVTFEVDMAMIAPMPDGTWELTYEVAGVEDGPLIDTIEITGDQYTVSEQVVGTPRKSTKLTVKATDLQQVGF